MYHHHQQSQQSRASKQMPAGSSDTNASSAVVPSLRLQEYSLMRAQRHIDDLLRRDSRAEKLLLGGAAAGRPEYHRLKREIRRKIDCLKCAAAAVAAAAGDQVGGSGGGAPQAAASSYSSRTGTEEERSGSSQELNSLLTQVSRHHRRYHNHHNKYPHNLCPGRRNEPGEKLVGDVKAKEDQGEEEEKATCSDAFTEEEEEEEQNEQEDEEQNEQEDEEQNEQGDEDEVVDQPGRLRDLDAPKQTQQQLLQRHCCISSQTTIAIQLLSQAHGESSSSLPVGSSGNLIAAAGAKPKATTMPEGAATWKTSRKLAPAQPPQFLLSAATWAAAAAASEPPLHSETVDNSQLLRSFGGDTTNPSNKKSRPRQEKQQQQQSYHPSLSHHRTLICPVQAAAPVAARAHSLSAVQTSIEPRTSTKTGSATETTPTPDNCSAPAPTATNSGRRGRTEVVMPPRQQFYHQQQQQHWSSSGSRKARQLPASIRRRRLQLRRDREQHTQQRCSMTFLPSDSFSSSAPVADRCHAIDKCLRRRLAACPVAQRFFQAIEVASATSEPTQVPLPRLFESTVQDAPTPIAFSPTVVAVLHPPLLCLLSRQRLPTLACLSLSQQGGVSASSSAIILPMRPLRLRQRASVSLHIQSSCFCCSSWGATGDEQQRDAEMPSSMVTVLRSFRTGFRVLERLSLTARLFPYSTDRPSSAGVRLGSALLQLLFYPEDVQLLVSEDSSDKPTLLSPTVIEQASIVKVGTSMDPKQRAIALPGATVCVTCRANAADLISASLEKICLENVDEDDEEDCLEAVKDEDDEDEEDCWRESYGSEDDDDEWRDPLVGDANNVFDDDDDGDDEDFATSDY